MSRWGAQFRRDGCRGGIDTDDGVNNFCHMGTGLLLLGSCWRLQVTQPDDDGYEYRLAIISAFDDVRLSEGWERVGEPAFGVQRWRRRRVDTEESGE